MLENTGVKPEIWDETYRFGGPLLDLINSISSVKMKQKEAKTQTTVEKVWLRKWDTEAI